MEEKYGFVYIWYDRKKKRYYVGCHWGTEDDGYVCSSSWMNRSYKNRPTDFKRRVLKRVYNRDKLLEIEYHYLKMIKPEELRKKYYNIRNHHWGHWVTNPDSRNIRQKISEAAKKRYVDNPEIKTRIANTLKGRKNPKHSEYMKNRIPWNKGIKTGKQTPEFVEKRMKNLLELIKTKRSDEWCKKISESQKLRHKRQKNYEK